MSPTLTPIMEKFLTKEGILDKFLYNVEHFSAHPAFIPIKSVAGSFCFNDTPEGEKFWAEMSTKATGLKTKYRNNNKTFQL